MPWRLLFLLMAMTAIGPAMLNVIVPALPGLVTRLGTDTGTVQLTISIYLLSFATAQLVLGPLSDRFGRRPVLLAGLALSVVASFAAITASSIGALIAVRIVQAFGASAGMVIGRAIIRDLYDRDRAAAMIGLVTTAMVLAPMVSPLIGGVLDTAFGWEAIFLFLAALTGVVLIWATAVLPETREVSAPLSLDNLWQEWRALLGSATFHGYVLCGALGSASFFTFIGGAPYVVVTLMGRSSAEFGVWFAIISLGYMLGNYITSRMAQRLGGHVMIVAGIALQIVGALMTITLLSAIPDGGPVVIFAPQFINSIGSGLVLPNAIAGAVSVRPHAAGAASGLAGFAQMGVGAAATQLVSILLAHSNSAMPMAWIMLSMVLATAVAYWALVGRRALRVPGAPE